MGKDSSTAVTRRGFLGASAGAAVSSYAEGRAAARTQGAQRTIDMTDNLVFDPDEATVAPGTTVVWDNVGTVGHSVTAYEDEIPEDAAYFASGGFDGEQAARNAYPEGDVAGGETYQHTFEVEGTYGYFCIPHETAGMVAELTVSADAGEGGDGGGALPDLPESARVVGIVTVAAMVSVVALAYFFLKYGGDYGLE
ncbi:plastocyanin/azurin family copper-binding protein [Halorussus rarus]|uniref:plastocyanin/azurin family copper-binding protein n=1 Tax=Halorussus TaxID=1070314 RepID=UPI000E2167B8|nr:plastocyanin [Halorussus sp. JP-T4]